MSNRRAVCTNLREQGILKQCLEQNKWVFWHMLRVAVTEGLKLFLYALVFICGEYGRDLSGWF